MNMTKRHPLKKKLNCFKLLILPEDSNFLGLQHSQP